MERSALRLGIVIGALAAAVIGLGVAVVVLVLDDDGSDPPPPTVAEQTITSTQPPPSVVEPKLSFLDDYFVSKAAWRSYPPDARLEAATAFIAYNQQICKDAESASIVDHLDT